MGMPLTAVPGRLLSTLYIGVDCGRRLPRNNAEDCAQSVVAKAETPNLGTKRRDTDEGNDNVCGPKDWWQAV